MKPSRNLFIHALGLSLAASFTANAITWDGGSNSTSNWIGGSGANSGERNWDTNAAPVANNPLIFAGTTRVAPNNNTTADTSYAGITFSNTAGLFVLGGNRITLGGDVINNDADLQTINMAMILSANRTFNAASGNITVGGVISGSGFGIIKTGSNTLSLNVSNTYTGTTDVQVGTLALGANDIFDNASFLKISGGILDTTASNRTDTVSTFEMTSGSLNGGGTITATTYTLSGGTVTGNLGTGTLNSSGTVALNGTSGATLVNVTAGSLTLGSANRLADGATVAVSGGTLAMGANTDTVSVFNMSSGAITGTGPLTATTYGLSGGTVTGNLGAGTMNVTTGTVSLNGTSGAAAVNVNSGTLSLGANDRLDNGATVLVAGGILDTTASNRTDTVSAFNMSSGSLNGGGTITAGTYGLSGGTVTANLGTGTLNSFGTVALNGTAGASAVNVTAGTLTLGSANRLADAAAVAVSGGALAIAGFDDTVGAVSLTGGSITGSGGTLTGSSYAVQSGSISAKLGGAGIALTKTTAGTVSLSAANTYTGATTIKAGTLELLSGGSLASPSLIVGDTGSTGAILDAITSGLIVASGQTVSGIGTIKGSTTIQLGGMLAPGNSAGILTNLGNVNLQLGSTFQMEINGATAGTGYDQLNVTGGSSIVTLAGLLSVTTGSTPTNGSLFFLIDNDGPSAISGVFSNAPINGNTYTFGSQQYAVSYFGDYGTTSFTGGNDVVLMAVPEPGAALIGGLGVLFLLRRRRGTTV
jgi:fibronectin-binding autotransporter adhesin